MLVTYPDARANKYICGAIATAPAHHRVNSAIFAVRTRQA
jgi:hypothetical protein